MHDSTDNKNVSPSSEKAGPGSGVEIERKYLVRSLPDLKNARNNEILQGYLAVDPDGTEVRLRRKGDRYFLTVKTGAGQKRGEIEQEIPESQFAAFWPMTEGKRLEKVRYELDDQDLVIELDVYRDALEGLQVAEVEFDSASRSAAFVPPPWFGKEITEESGYKNRNLALKGRPKDS